MNRFAELEIFVRIVETGGVGAAAKRIGIAKSVISRRLKDLEDRLGTRLINRTTRTLSLTEAGRAYFERASRILADLDEADALAVDTQGSLRGVIRVAAPLSFGLLHLAPAVHEFLDTHPDLNIDLDLNDRRVDVIEEGFDMAVRIGELEDSSLIARKLAPSRHILVASPDFIQRHGPFNTAEDLTGLPGLRYSGVSERRSFQCQDPEGTIQSPVLPIRMVANNGDILVQAACAGLGVLVIPSFIAQKAIEAGDVSCFLRDHDFGGQTAYALYPPGRHLSVKVRRFIDFLGTRFGKQPYWDKALGIVGD